MCLLRPALSYALQDNGYSSVGSNSDQSFVKDIVASKDIQRIDNLVLNAGILEYPNVSRNSLPLRILIDQASSVTQRATELYESPIIVVDYKHCVLKPVSSFDAYSKHLSTNAIGPIIAAQRLLKTRIPIGTITFMSSDSGSMINFRAFEDG